MVGRLIADSTKVIASKPGIEVSTATPGDLIFDSRSQKYLSAYAIGAFGSASFVYDSAGSAGGPISGTSVYKFTVYFGKTFAAPPKVFLSYRTGFFDTGLNAADSWSINSITTFFDAGIGGYYSDGMSVEVSVLSFLDKAVFEVTFRYGRSIYYYEPIPDIVYFMVAQSA